jgi:hypothetical protein
MGGPVHPLRVMSAHSASVRLSVVADAGWLGREDLSMSTTAPRRTRRLTDAQLEEMLALTSHADSVELKLTVPDCERRSIVTGLGMDPLDAQIRQVFFFDTPDLRLNKQGVAVRVVVQARRVQGRGDVTVVKLRPIVPGELPQPLLALRHVAGET